MLTNPLLDFRKNNLIPYYLDSCIGFDDPRRPAPFAYLTYSVLIPRKVRDDQ